MRGFLYCFNKRSMLVFAEVAYKNDRHDEQKIVILCTLTFHTKIGIFFGYNNNTAVLPWKKFKYVKKNSMSCVANCIILKQNYSMSERGKNISKISWRFPLINNHCRGRRWSPWWSYWRSRWRRRTRRPSTRRSTTSSSTTSWAASSLSPASLATTTSG